MFLTMAVLAAHAAHGQPQMTPVSLLGPMVCKVEDAPHINVTVKSDEIDYDYSRSAAGLKSLENNTVSPYPPGVDTATGGLREEHPTIGTNVRLEIVSNQWLRQGCVRYKSINIEMHLRPKIYVAKEFDTGTCRQAVLAHELKHVRVDREVMNKYAAMIAPQVKDVVNRTGALGPFDMKNTEAVKAQAAGYITKVTDKLEKAMEEELDARQRAVDSLEEYTAVGRFCSDVNLTPFVCKVEKTPHVKVAVMVKDIEYDYTRSARELTAVKTYSKSPFPPSSDMVTRGLREDHPTIQARTQWGIVWEQKGNMACMQYETVDIELHLQPKIFLARELGDGPCRDAVLTHERKHIQVDREVINKYAGIVGKTVQDIVSSAGALGPFNMKNVDAVKGQLTGKINQTMDKMQSAMVTELRARQKNIDSLDEYNHVSSFCKNVHIGK